MLTQKQISLIKKFNSLVKSLEEEISKIQESVNVHMYGLNAKYVRDDDVIKWTKLVKLNCPAGARFKDGEEEFLHKPYEVKMEPEGDFLVCKQCDFKIEKKRINKIKNILERQSEIEQKYGPPAKLTEEEMKKYAKKGLFKFSTYSKKDFVLKKQ